MKRDSEIKQFNYVYDSDKPTRNIILEKIKLIDEMIPETEKVSAIIGHGVGFGRSWEVTFGEGLWYYLIKPYLPDIKGLRILDISDMDPLFSLRMLLSGAAEVVRIQENDRWDWYTGFLKEAFEWVSSSTIKLSVQDSKLEYLAGHQLDPFDLVFVGENFFHIPDQAQIPVLHYFRSLGIRTIISCIENPGDASKDRNEEISHKSKIGILEASGYKTVKNVSKSGCNHQLLVCDLV